MTSETELNRQLLSVLCNPPRPFPRVTHPLLVIENSQFHYFCCAGLIFCHQGWISVLDWQFKLKIKVIEVMFVVTKRACILLDDFKPLVPNPRSVMSSLAHNRLSNKAINLLALWLLCSFFTSQLILPDVWSFLQPKHFQRPSETCKETEKTWAH